MRIELDHVFVCCAEGAPEAAKLVQFGLREGPPNEHAGQGTACRRFSFANAMIELLWVRDDEEAQNERTRRIMVWERWSGRKSGAAPFGICVRPTRDWETGVPFPVWEYRPEYLAAPLCIQIGEAGVEEPMWIYLSFMRRAQREGWFGKHPNGAREITDLTLTTPVALRSAAAQKIVESGVLRTRSGETSLLEIELDAQRRNERVDLRPELPIVFLR